MKDTFTINDLALMTGLSTRTIRNYMGLGFLSGEKVNGCWTFTAEQVEAFTQNKAVQAAIKAKKNAVVFDFLGTKPYGGDKMCAILDLASKDAMAASVFFCERISECSPEADLHFTSERFGTGVRLIFSGSPKDVMNLLNQYHEHSSL